jgi:uncharacterized protein YlaN (UPF0358 family)
MFGLQKEVDFAVKLGLVDREDGKQIMLRLEKELSKLHEAFTPSRSTKPNLTAKSTSF